MQGILKGWDSGVGKRIQLQIFDNAQVSDDSLLYDSQSKVDVKMATAPLLTLQIFTDFNDRKWCLRFTQADGQLNYVSVYGILSCGMIISLLLFGLNFSLFNTRYRAQQLAEQLTVDIRESEESYRNQFANNSVAMLLIDPADGAIIDANVAALSFYGYMREQLLTMNITNIKLDLEVLDFDLSSSLDDFAGTLALRAHEKGLELLCAADLNVPTLLSGDPGRLRQILTNLTGNAIKFTHAGEVSVRVSLVEDGSESSGQGTEIAGSWIEGWVHGDATKVGGNMKSETVMLRFSVRDTGIGIPTDKIVRLFKEFSQVDGSTTREYGGSGLGLSISKQLAELMGGEAGVSSEEGKGSEFWFTARFNKQAVGAHKESIPPADLHGVRVLIVDDSATSREILTTRMVSWGMCPTVVKDGPDALRALHLALDENDPFCVAVIDMRMPGMDGETLGRTIRADKRLTDTRMMLLTSIGTRGDARRFQQIGFSAYATKPIQHRELKAVLSLVLAEQDGIEPKPITTRHLAREKMNLFIDRKARILLAEDNVTNQLVAMGILKKLGMRADAVFNGAEALIALQAKPYDLVGIGRRRKTPLRKKQNT